MKRQLVYMDAKSSKFWNIELAANSHTVTYGRIGTDGQSLTKPFPTEEAAQKDMEKLIREKLGKGYVDAAGSGADATSAAKSADGLIPLIAFTSINRREEIGQNAGTFIGKRVVDYDTEKPAKTDVVYQFRSDWEDNELIPNLEHFLATSAAPETPALVIGAWHGDDPELTPEEAINLLVNKKD